MVDFPFGDKAQGFIARGAGEVLADPDGIGRGCAGKASASAAAQKRGIVIETRQAIYSLQQIFVIF